MIRRDVETRRKGMGESRTAATRGPAAKSGALDGRITGRRPIAGSGRRHGPSVSLLALAMVLALLIPCVLGSAARAVEIETASRPVARRVVALFDGRHEKVASETRIHRFAEMPLNHLGFVVEYRDVPQPLPAPADLDGARAVLTWFLEPLERPHAVAQWLETATRAGLRHVVLGEIAPPATAATSPSVRRLLRRLGLADESGHAGVTYKARVATLDREVVGFERPVDAALPEFPHLTALSGGTRVHLGLETSLDGVARTAAVITTSPAGGLAVHDYALFYEPSTDRVAWTLNPFAFLALAVGAELWPVPDTTTASGRRLYFSHIDGDGWNNVSEIAPFRDQQMLSSEVILREAIAPYPDLPVSVGVIAGDVRSELGGSRGSRRVARRLFELPQVEVASHTNTHPFAWSFFERYDRAEEERLIAGAARPIASTREQIAGLMRWLAGVEAPRSAPDRYIAGSDDLPRTYMREPFDLGREIAGALSVAEAFAPRGKKPQLYLWSGDTSPFEAAIAATREAGVRNMNGGDSRLDAAYPSVAYVPPLSRPVGRQRQIYAANSNENTYTNDWTGPYSGFLLLEETLRNTDAPRRLKPFNLYYHMYSGEKPAALAAIRHFLDLARRSPLAPVAASTYAAMADDFFGVEVTRVAASAWTVARRGSVQTVRLDAADALAVEGGASRGVLGAKRHAGALYVALDPAVESALLVLTARPDGDAVAVVGAAESLVEARWRLSKRTERACGLGVKADGYGPGEMVWQARPGRAYKVAARRAGEALWEGEATADGDGRLAFTILADALEGLDIEMTCDG